MPTVQFWSNEEAVAAPRRHGAVEESHSKRQSSVIHFAPVRVDERMDEHVFHLAAENRRLQLMLADLLYKNELLRRQLASEQVGHL